MEVGPDQVYTGLAVWLLVLAYLLSRYARLKLSKGPLSKFLGTTLANDYDKNF